MTGTDLQHIGPWIALGLGALATYFWRALGTFLSGKIKPEGAVFEWVACVAYALLAGLVTRMIFLPVGALEATPMWLRLAAAAAALGVFFLFRRNLVWGLVAGVGMIMVLG